MGISLRQHLGGHCCSFWTDVDMRLAKQSKQ